MSINGIGAGYPAWRETGKAQRNNAGTDFAGMIVGSDTAGSVSFQSNSVQAAGYNTVLEAYRISTVSALHNIRSDYEKYESENYKIVPDNEAGCFDIYNKQGEKIGAFEYSDIKVRQDSATGKQFLISEHGTMSYDAVVMDNELKEALQNVMGVSTLETEKLQGFTLKTHYGTGIQYLVRDGEEGRGGKVLLQSQADIEKYEALAETYFNKYPNLVHDKDAAYIWADLEIKGLAQHTDNGIVSMGFDGIFYNDNSDYKNNWNVRFSGDTYKVLLDWLQNNRGSIEEMRQFVALQETDSITDMQINMLVSETVQARFTLQEVDEEGNHKEDIYLIAVDKNGIRCSKTGQSEYEWEIVFTDESQYENATEFLNYAGRFMDNFLFAAHENFWEDYLNGNMAVDNFREFLKGTNNGIPDYSYTVGDSVYIDKEKAQWAQYMNNPLGAKLDFVCRALDNATDV
ncbi:MAG: hypothetical protein NC313_13250 [Butyrivibrio sp.]|nr:hypothetical protein [Butyrivibrio sp.]